jgi:hypothetical protein
MKKRDLEQEFRYLQFPCLLQRSHLPCSEAMNLSIADADQNRHFVHLRSLVWDIPGHGSEIVNLTSRY